MKDQHKEETLSAEEIEKIKTERLEALASLAALFGVQLEHYGRMQLHITFPGDADHDQWFGDENMTEEEADAILEASGWKEDTVETSREYHRDSPYVKEPESLSALVAQILTLLNPKIKAVFGSSAIYSILSTAATAYGREGTSVEEKINGMSFPAASQAWIISKRIFATNHLNDLRRMIDLLMIGDKTSEFIMKDGKPLMFEEATDKDRQDVAEYCQLILSQEAGTVEDSSTIATAAAQTELKEITEIQATGNIVLMTSKVARNLLPIAKGKGVAKINVGPDNRPVEVKAEIVGRDGEKSVTLTRTDYDVMEAVGQIVQENGTGIIITPAQIYQKLAFSDPSYHPSAQTINEIVASMDKLLFTPITLDITAQIEKNTKLKTRKDKDLLIGKFSKDTLISGKRMENYTTSYKGRAVEHSFLIRDMPILFSYSEMIHHLVTIPGFLLSGNNAPADIAKAQKAEGSQRATLTDLGLQRHLLESIEYFKKLKEKQADKNWRKGIYMKDYSYQMAFDTITEKIGYGTTPKKQRMLREQTYKFLRLQVTRKNIKAVEYYYKGRAISGVTITL